MICCQIRLQKLVYITQFNQYVLQMQAELVPTISLTICCHAYSFKVVSGTDYYIFLISCASIKPRLCNYVKKVLVGNVVLCPNFISLCLSSDYRLVVYFINITKWTNSILKLRVLRNVYNHKTKLIIIRYVEIINILEKDNEKVAYDKQVYNFKNAFHSDAILR